MIINKGNGTCKVLENKFSLRDSLKNKWILVWDNNKNKVRLNNIKSYFYEILSV